MKPISMYQTFDGKLHFLQSDAKKHLDSLYADKLLPLAGKLANIDKYTEMAGFIDGKLELFAELQRIKDDMILVTANEEEN